MAILSFGTRLGEVLTAAEALRAQGITPTIADVRFAKPLDRGMILDLTKTHEALITIEEGAVGGFGSHVAQLLVIKGYLIAVIVFVRWCCQTYSWIRPVPKIYMSALDCGPWISWQKYARSWDKQDLRQQVNPGC